VAFTAQALLLWYLHSRKYTGAMRVGSTLLRAILGSAVAGLVVFFLMQLPFSGFLLALGSLVLGSLIALPFIWPEVKVLIKL
jgi:hypothetical protein